MKKILACLVGTLIALQGFTQITLEHTYPNMAGIAMGGTGTIVNLGGGMYNYMFYNRNARSLSLYHMNHSLNVSCTFDTLVPFGASMQLAYVSRTLFDCDSTNIEYLISTTTSNIANNTVKVLRTDGTILFSKDSARQMFVGTGLGNTSFIFKVNNDTKMLLYGMDSSALVYDLCGELTTGMVKEVGSSNQMEETLNSYPNPSYSYTNVNYTLPEGISNGELIFYDNQGREVKRFKVDRTFDHLRISTEEMPSGTYYYHLQTTAGVSQGKKHITIK